MTRLIALLLILSLPCAAKSKKKFFVTLAEHVSLGAAVEVGVSQVAGGPQKFEAGLLAAGLVAGFKESADAIAGRDTRKQAAIHALEIVAGAGVMAAVRH